jgi:hypothetical protein
MPPALEKEPPPSAFEQGTRSFGVVILKLALIMVLFAIGANALRGRPWLDSFLFAVALAVGLAPEMLPMVVSVTLSRGAIRMSRQKVLVKRLAAIHDLGSMDVLCTDKTGTLTEARIRVERLIAAAGRRGPVRFRATPRIGPRPPRQRRAPLDRQGCVRGRTVSFLALRGRRWRDPCAGLRGPGRIVITDPSPSTCTVVPPKAPFAAGAP